VPTANPTPTSSQEVAAACVPKKTPFNAKNIDLTGPWAGDDFGVYYLRQLGDVVWWNGMSDRDGPPNELGRAWNNVGRGELNSDMTMSVEWADVPRGQILGGGTLAVKVGPDGAGNIQIVKTAETAGTGFGNTVWVPCAPG
jgi:hypothetical protein